MTKNKKTADVPPPAAKPHNRTETVIALLKRDGGATLEDITEATKWQPHSTRAMLTGLRKKGHAIETSRLDGVTRWSITADQAERST